MRILWTMPASASIASLRYVFKTLLDALSREHDVDFLPPDLLYQPPDRQVEMLEGSLRSADLVFGLPSPVVLAARQQLGLEVPGVFFLIGRMSHGGFSLAPLVQYLTSADVLVGNCRADVELADKFVRNVRTWVLPLSYDEQAFHPLDPDGRARARAALGLDENKKVLLYAGRVTLEKNVLGLLRVFSGVLRSVPEAVLLIAGSVGNVPFTGVGSEAGDLLATGGRAIRKLGLPEGSVRVLGPLAPDRLRRCYAAADVAVSLTLHHDENFGLAQVEAMACGTPVVGTNWGGLKDTIVDGVSGYKLSAVVTPLGVKVNWWEAINRIVELLRDSAARERFRTTCPRHAAEQYSAAVYADRIRELVGEAVRRPPLLERASPTAFAEELWSVCSPGQDRRPPFRRGPRSWELYQELITPFAGATAWEVPAGEALDESHVLVLAAPASLGARGRVVVDDPIYPFELEVPAGFVQPARAVLRVLRSEPAITAGRLLRERLGGAGHAAEAVAWMLETGLLLRTRGGLGPVDPRRAGGQLGRRLYTVQRIAATGDVVSWR
jgi:glycosyltransferase involved in cell wall biosynthesis